MGWTILLNLRYFVFLNILYIDHTISGELIDGLLYQLGDPGHYDLTEKQSMSNFRDASLFGGDCSSADHCFSL